MSGEDVLFEAQPSGWPVRGSSLVAATLVLGAATLLALLGLRLSLPGSPLQVAPVLPALLAVAAIELVRVARWRSTRYVVERHRVVLRRGVVVVGDVAAAPTVGGRLVRARDGPAVEWPDPPYRLTLEGLEPDVWPALAEAFARAGGRASDGFTSTAAEERRRPRVGVSPWLAVPVLLLLVAVGAFADWRDRRRLAVRAEFAGAAAAVRGAVRAATLAATSAVRAAWLAGPPPGSPSNTAAVRVFVTSERQSLGDDSGLLECELVVVVPSHPSRPLWVDASRWVRVTCLQRGGLVPAAPIVQVAGSDDPLTRIVLDAVRRELARAGVRYDDAAGP